MLEEFGLPANVEAVYRLLVTTPSVSETDVARSLKLAAEDVTVALGTLEQHALASQAMVGADRRWTAVPPLLTGQRLLVERAQRLFRAQRELLELAEAHQRAARASGAENMVEIVLGEQAARAQVRRLQESATEEILGLVKPPFIAVPVDEAARGVMSAHSRIVYDQSIFDHVDDLPELIRHAAHPGDRARVHPRVPMRLQIYNRRTAVLPLVRHDAQPAMLVVHASGLLTMAVELFEAIWAQAVPLPIDAGGSADLPNGRLGPDDRRVLGLLLAGLTDATIAHQLSRSQRWVQRRVRLMSDAAGVRTRLQLGWEAHRRGWLDDDDAISPPASDATAQPSVTTPA